MQYTLVLSSPCSPDWSCTHSGPAAAVSQVLGLQVCATCGSSIFYLSQQYTKNRKSQYLCPLQNNWDLCETDEKLLSFILCLLQGMCDLASSCLPLSSLHLAIFCPSVDQLRPSHCPSDYEGFLLCTDPLCHSTGFQTRAGVPVSLLVWAVLSSKSSINLLGIFILSGVDRMAISKERAIKTHLETAKSLRDQYSAVNLWYPAQAGTGQ